MAEQVASAVDDTRVKDNILHLVRTSPAPLYVIRLSDTVLLEISDAALSYVGRTREELVGSAILDAVQDPENARRSFDLLAAGVIDSFTRKGHFRRADGSFQPIEARYTTCFEPANRSAAIGQIIQSPMPDPVGVTEEDAPECISFLGTVDPSWRIDRISSGVEPLLGMPSADLLGQAVFTFVHPEDVSGLLLLAAHAAGQSMGATGRLRLRNADGGWSWARITVHELVAAPSGSFAFAVAGIEPEPATGPRAQELEDHLRRIAREIAASGVAALSTAVPTAAELPQISDLTTREYEIVVRLAHGERVPSIARSLFLSESTVRNHLTSVYRKFGVSSQVELLDRFGKVRAGQG